MLLHPLSLHERKVTNMHHEYYYYNKEQLLDAASAYGKSPYGEHLRRVAEDRLRLVHNR